MERKIRVLKKIMDLDRSISDLKTLDFREKEDTGKAFRLGKIEMMHEMVRKLRMEYEMMCIAEWRIRTEKISEEE